MNVIDVAAAARDQRARSAAAVRYRPRQGVDDFVRQLGNTTPLQMVATERHGVPGRFIKDLSRRMDMPSARMFTMLGVPRATGVMKAASSELLSGHGGQAAIGVARLLGLAQNLVAESTAPAAKDFDAAKWLGRWLEQPQPALGGHRPADLIDTPTGLDIVGRLLGSLASGAYQ